MSSPTTSWRDLGPNASRAHRRGPGGDAAGLGATRRERGATRRNRGRAAYVQGRMNARLATVAAILLLTACGTQVAGPASGSTSGAPSKSGSGSGTGADPGDTTAGMIAVAKLSDIAGVYEAPAEQPRPPRALVPGTTIRLTVLDAQISLNAGCNTMSGPARVEDSHLIVESLAMTEMGCAQALMDQDAWLADWIAGKPRLHRSGPYLGIVQGDDWLSFTRAERQVLPATPSDPDSPVSSPSSKG